MSQPTLAELAISLSHVQLLLKQITAEVKVLSDGIAVLVEQEEAEDLEEELNYLDVDPWSNAKDKDSNTATTSRRDSIRSLMQRRPSTVKDETKALARILSQKRQSGNGAGSGSESEAIPAVPSTPRFSQQTDSHHLSSNLQEHVIDEEYASSEGSSSLHAGRQDSPVEAERVPHTITVQSTQMPTKFPISITKATVAQSPTISSSSSNQNSGQGTVNSQNGTISGRHTWRSATSPNMFEGSRPSSVASSIAADGYLSRDGKNTQPRRSLQPESRDAPDNQALTHGSVRDRLTQAVRSSSQGTITSTSTGRDTVKSTFTIKSPTPMMASQVDRMESADCFSKLGLLPELLRGIYAYGLKMPSILQQRGIPMIMTKHDVLTQAKPEVAKTLTYAIPLLNALTLPATSIHPQLLILCSNHDLCLHVQRVLLALARFMPTISCLICAEGSNATLSLGTMSTTQVNTGGNRTSKYGQNGYGSVRDSNIEPLPVIAAHVVIGTPGKVLTLIKTKQISLTALKVMVLENADILLSSPLKEATVSLLSMVRDPALNAAAGNTGSPNGTIGVSGTGADAFISPPNSGPASPVSKAVAALNEKIMSSNPSPETRPRSLSGASGSLYSSSVSIAAAAASPSTPPANSQPQLLFYSTEVPSHVLDYVAQYMTQPTKALVKGHELALKGILQFFKYMTVEDEEWQVDLLCDILENSGVQRTVVFCNKDRSVDRVVAKIRERNGIAIGVYSDMELATRKAAVGRFRGSTSPTSLVLTDEAAKELDIVAVPLVISFEIPSVSNYIPRVKWIDRSKGKVGAKVTLVDGHKGEGHGLRAIQQHYRTTIDDMPASVAEFLVN